MLFDRRFLCRLVLLLPLAAVVFFCFFYLFHDYNALARWYESLPGPFYRKPYWRAELFTPQTWQKGRLWCGLALVICPILIWAVLKVRFPEKQRWERADGLATILIASVALALGIFSASIPEIAMDEDQSAMFFGSTHPFRALSHYPVPNNHILYNALNSLVATPETALLWGKIIAILGYAGGGIITYRWLLVWNTPRHAAVLMTLLSLTIFPAWGFAGQARSYTLYLLASWWALLLATRYLRTNDARNLALYPVAVAVGYGMLPTFIYFHVGLCMWGLGQCLINRQILWPFWRAQVFAVAASFLVLLPLLSFSGFRAIAGHQWVAPMPWSDFTFPPFGPFRDYFTGYGKLGYLLGILAALSAVALLFRKKTRLLGSLTIALWIGCDVVVAIMRQTPFTRQLMGLYSVSAVVGLLAAFYLLQILATRFGAKWFYPVAALTGLATSVAVMAVNHERMADALYLYNVAERNSKIEAMLDRIPEGTSVGFTDNAFLPKALWQRRGKAIVPAEKALYLVQLEDVNPVYPSDSLVASYINIRVYKKSR